jgi:Zn-dependent M28 family amino/carboxypeptidase
VIVAFFDQEEVGLIGAGAFADRLVQLATPVAAVHTIDQAGWDADGDRRFELELPAAGLEPGYAAAAARLGASVTVTGTTGSDHQAFRQRGFAAVGVTEEFATGDTTPHYHEATDTYATVNQAYAQLAARLVAETVMDQVE